MAAIPVQGANAGTWGTDLNAYLQTEHSATGTHEAITATSVTATGNVAGATGGFTGLMSAVNYNILSADDDALFYEGEIVTY